MNVMVDSAVYIDWLRAKIDPRQQLAEALLEGRLYNCGVVRAEVLRGIKNETIYVGMEAFFNIIPEVPCDARLWHNVSGMAWRLQRWGKRPPLTDIVIALCALRVGATLVSPDADFEDIPMLELRKTWES